ncbi:MAG: hypothetical protein COB04_07635 [Gammaproteobacteria bacterium]|nr:MAG: hypothetical protein COB04_07635 [Gammaproteobacteria bacterium]
MYSPLKLTAVFLCLFTFNATAENSPILDHPATSSEIAGEDIIDLRPNIKRDHGSTPSSRQCLATDVRVFHNCFEARFLKPGARVYFDTGADSKDEIDIFENGEFNPTVDVASIYLPWRFGTSSYFDPWSWGPLLGVGISTQTKESLAPVVLASYGLLVEYTIGVKGASFGLELGRAIGFSSDESFEDNTDSATYVGLKITIPTLGK